MAPSVRQDMKVKSRSANASVAARKPKIMISTAEMFKPVYKQKLAAVRSDSAIAKSARAHHAGVQKRVKTSKKASSHPLSDVFNDASSEYIDTVLEEGLESLNLAHRELISRLNKDRNADEDAAHRKLTCELTRPFDTESLSITEKTLNGEKKTNVTLGGQMKDFAALIKKEEENLAKLMEQHEQVTEDLERLMALCCEDDPNQDIIASMTVGWWERASKTGEMTEYPDGRPVEPPDWDDSHRVTRKAAELKLVKKLQKLEEEIEQLGTEELAQMAQDDKENEAKKRTAIKSLLDSARHLL